MQQYQIHPIGYVRCDQRYRYETPRQGVLADGSHGIIELEPGKNFEQGLYRLEGFSHIWVIYGFHLNTNWKPMVQPPRHSTEKVGVFATRAPYRPNAIGLSAVQLERVDGLRLEISDFDMLDGSPVFDIKPYLPYCDSFPDAAVGWAQGDFDDIFEIEFSDKALEQERWLQERCGLKLGRYAQVQLQTEPTNGKRKRIAQLDSSLYELSYRTWRILYRVTGEGKKVIVAEYRSGYTSEELNDPNDPYDDKQIHRDYTSAFGITDNLGS
ncbi:MAG: tRNA (N6-threonylcarbamoyladenosine(37)-N6)-methyltransferase TrmO [Ectothiorhodospiraceae bacterium]|nr:tRNA (N6-threonylcarbamoyladenosine(37)-N6)-methyltransferase TrmO [Ectothiorhodospiraceae bacterium]